MTFSTRRSAGIAYSARRYVDPPPPFEKIEKDMKERETAKLEGMPREDSKSGQEKDGENTERPRNRKAKGHITGD